MTFIFTSCIFKTEQIRIPVMNITSRIEITTDLKDMPKDPLATDPRYVEAKKNPKKIPKITPSKRFEDIIFTHETFYNRIYDCNGNTNELVPIRSQVKEFNFTNPRQKTPISFGLIENNGWPILLGYSFPKKIEKKQNTILFLRGDRSGFHRSPITQFILDFIKEERKESIVLFLEELLYASPERNLIGSDLMILCHYKDYPLYGRIGGNWPALENDGAWDMINKLFYEVENRLEIVSFSNGILPRSEFIKRNLKKGKRVDYFNPEKDNPSEYLQKYLDATEHSSPNVKQVYGILDVEGHYFDGKPLWDLAAFLLEEIEPSEEKYYYAISRIEEDKVHQLTIRLLQALNLEGEEDENGIIRYQNQKGNIVFDVVTSTKPPYYSYYGLDLRMKTKFKQAVNPKRISITHGNLIELGFQRMPKAKFYIAEQETSPEEIGMQRKLD